jgi:hypothetical protein
MKRGAADEPLPSLRLWPQSQAFSHTHGAAFAQGGIYPRGAHSRAERRSEPEARTAVEACMPREPFDFGRSGLFRY